jgi:NAD(P)-dependent dehydrogenase (short-subunit alcohol dehydrogenase family)
VSNDDIAIGSADGRNQRKRTCALAGTNGRLAGKVALITGAGSGIGAVTAKLFAAEGARVAAAGRRAETLTRWEGVENVLPIQADITRLEDIERMFAEAERRFGQVDIVCNIAGIHDQLIPLDATTDELWDKVMATDLKAPFRICRRAIGGMVDRGGGVILNFGSVASLRGYHGPSYNAAKAGLIGMTVSIAFAYGGSGIRCNVINSGPVRTEINEHSGGGLHQEGRQRWSGFVQGLPMNVVAEPEDMASTVLFLCSDDARNVNGAVLSVDGGMSAC